MSEIVIPPPPQTVHCSKCSRDAVVAVNFGRPGIKNECTDPECLIASDPDNQPSDESGILICFPEGDEISE